MSLSAANNRWRSLFLKAEYCMGGRQTQRWSVRVLLKGRKGEREKRTSPGARGVWCKTLQVTSARWQWIFPTSMASAVRSEVAAVFFKANFQQPEPSAVQWEGACGASRRCRIQPGLNWAVQAVEQPQVPRQAAALGFRVGISPSCHSQPPGAKQWEMFSYLFTKN